MFQNRLITLLTDFGLQDVYVGVIKGVIAQVNPGVSVVDLTHEIPPQDLASARFCLMNSVSYFPEQTVHIAVVDPGVGSYRRGVAIKFAGGFLVGPDNGIFSGVLQHSPAQTAVELTNADYWRTFTPSSTFHGRDIFATVGAHLASGIELETLGNLIDPTTLIQLDLPKFKTINNEVFGCIQYIDRFGNLVSNIPASAVENLDWVVTVAQQTITKGKTYSETHPGDLIALIGSHGWVEIAVNSGNAQTKLQAKMGMPVIVKTEVS